MLVGISMPIPMPIGCPFLVRSSSRALHMAQSEQVSKQRAETALKNVTGGPANYPMHLGSYRADSRGGSVRTTMAHHFVEHHDVAVGDDLLQFFDPETGALVLVPESGTDQCPSMQGSD